MPSRWRRFFRRVQLPIPLGLNLLLMPGEHVLWRDVANGAVQTHVVVMLYVTLHQTKRIFERQRRLGPNALLFDEKGVSEKAGCPGKLDPLRSNPKRSGTR
jgi:hypothetical protein